LNKAENEGTGDENKNGSESFKELLGLCKQDLDEILNRLKSQMKNENTEDLLRKELLE
jgi:hypothetical protein